MDDPGEERATDRLGELRSWHRSPARIEATKLQ